ncbi:hypothetical protein GGQ94_000993 [Petrimonas sulfuriphila]
MFFKYLVVTIILVLPPLIRMKYNSTGFQYFIKNLVQHFIYHSHILAFGDIRGYYLTIKHVKYWGQLYFLILDLYLCNIRSPFLVGKLVLKFLSSTLGVILPTSPLYDKVADFSNPVFQL